MKEIKYLKYNLGEINMTGHIDAVHAQRPNSDQYTGEIVEQIIKQQNISGIIATISRNEMDINRPRNMQNAPAIDEFRETIKEIISSKNILDRKEILTKNYLHIAIHGMKDNKMTEFEIGTRNGTSCSIEVLDWFISHLKTISNKYGINSKFAGNISKSYHRYGDLDSGYNGYGERFHTIQIEINRIWRKNLQVEIVSFLLIILKEFDKKFN